MHFITFNINSGEQFTLSQVLVASGFLPQEITPALLEEVWNESVERGPLPGLRSAEPQGQAGQSTPSRG